jgi:hypothetical protein
MSMPQVEHAALLERLHAHQQQLAAVDAPEPARAADSSTAAPAAAAAPPEAAATEQAPSQAVASAPEAPQGAAGPGGAEVEMAEAGAEAADKVGDVTWPNVRELVASRLRMGEGERWRCYSLCNRLVSLSHMQCTANALALDTVRCVQLHAPCGLKNLPTAHPALLVQQALRPLPPMPWALRRHRLRSASS